VNSVKLLAFLIAVGMSVAFGYSLGESAGRRAAADGSGPSEAGVSQYQYEQMARQFSRTVYEQYAAAPDRDNANPHGSAPAPAARPQRPQPPAGAAKAAKTPAADATPISHERNDDE
jgi:hypothetical protein